MLGIENSRSTKTQYRTIFTNNYRFGVHYPHCHYMLPVFRTNANITILSQNPYMLQSQKNPTLTDRSGLYQKLVHHPWYVITTS